MSTRSKPFGTPPRWTILLLAGLVTCAFAADAWARQVRVNVVNFEFQQPNVSASTGDHVVWYFIASGHTATSGDPDTGPDGLFNSGNAGVGAAFAWEVNATGTRQYFCIPHFADMAGLLTLTASGATGLSDFRITEVQFNAANNLDLIEITNLGAAGDLAKYRLKISGVAVQTLQIGTTHNIAVPAGGRVVLHLGASGTPTATDLFFPAIAGLPATGSLGLYVPSTLAAHTALTRADLMIDYVQWGAGGQENEATAQSAALWSAGAALLNVADGHSIEFCGNTGEYGFTHWAEISTPNFGSDGNCLTPSLESTWGRLKTIYR